MSKAWHITTVRTKRWIISTQSYHAASMVSRAMCEAGEPCTVVMRPMVARLSSKVVQIIR